MKKLASIGFALLMIFAVFVPFASATAPRDYTMKVNPNPAGEGVSDGMGSLYVQLACRAPQIGGEFSVSNVIVSAPFTDAARVDKGFVDQFVKVIGVSVTHKYLPDGTFDMRIAPGTYLLTQIDGNGGQPEFALVTVTAGEKETVVFLGHGISGITETPKVVITVTEATYGAQRVVVDQEAYDETVTDSEAYYEHAHDHANVEVPCTHYHAAQTHQDYEAGHVHAKKVGGYSSHDFEYGGDKYQIVQNNEHYDAFIVTSHTNARIANTVTIVDHEAYYEHSHDHATVEVPCTHFHAACTHVVHHPAVTHTEGTFVSVKAEVQALLDGGQQVMVFRNDANPGGIFDTAGHLMKTIADPAYGQVKTVMIKYTVDGGAVKTVNAQEYQTINLV